MTAAPDCQSAGAALFERNDIKLLQPVAGPPRAIPVFDKLFLDGNSMPDARARRLPVSHVSFQQRYCIYLN